MIFFCYCKDLPGKLATRMALVEDHWQYMDGFARSMLARGPTLMVDGHTPAGSIHVLDLPEAEDAYRFVTEEPTYRAGVIGDFFLAQWNDLTGRRMRDFVGAGGTKFMVLSLAEPTKNAPYLELYRAFVSEGEVSSNIVLAGTLGSLSGKQFLGTAAFIEAEGLAKAETLFSKDPLQAAGFYGSTEILHWRFGGRPYHSV